MFSARSWVLLANLLSHVTAVTFGLSSSTPSSFPPVDEDISDCILLFGAYANGNMGDIIQSSTMMRLISYVAPESTCVWIGHPGKETRAKGFHEGEFFATNTTSRVSLGCDRESGEQASRFKALIIGGGGIFEAKHWPLHCEDFVEGLGPDLRVVIFGVGASWEASASASIIRRADYVSGRDEKSVRELSSLLGALRTSRSRGQDVSTVRDPVLSDGYFLDIDGKCWRRTEEQTANMTKKPLCFVLPSATKRNLQEVHRIYSSKIVQKGDILLNVFPKHQAEIEAYPYPVPVEQTLNPFHFASRLCDCGAVVASRLHGAIISLQAGIPTIAAWPDAEENKIPDLMKKVLRFPDQFLLIDESITRETLTRKVQLVDKRYSMGQRQRIFEKLKGIAMHTEQEYARILSDVLQLPLPRRMGSSSESSVGGFWRDVQDEEATLTTTGQVGRATVAPMVGEELPVAPAALSSAWVAGGALTLAGNILVALATLIMIALLMLPTLAYRSRCKSIPPQQSKAGLSELPKGLELPREGELAISARIPSSEHFVGQGQIRMLDVAFFGFNYILWVVLALGFSIFSERYMRETRNPMALLAIEGWVGIALICAFNLTARYRRDDAALSPSTSCPVGSPETCPATSSVCLKHLSSIGNCRLVEARRLGRSVWQAGLLHASDAVLVSWSVLIGGVAYTQTFKALEPVAAAGFSRWFLGSSLSPGRAAAVAVIVVGLTVLMVPMHRSWSADDPHDEERGSPGQGLTLAAVLTACACCAIAARNVLLKSPDTPPPPPLGLLACSIVGASIGSLALLVPWLPFGWEWATEPLLRMSGINAALCSVGYNLASFNLLSELSPVGLAVGNASNHIFVFGSGLYLLGDGSISFRQLGGASVALLGFASYNLARS